MWLVGWLVGSSHSLGTYAIGIMHANVVWGTPLIDAILGTNDERKRKHLANTWPGYQLIQYARLNLIE